ncbi:MAG: hypothetical protein CFE23_11645 [Flavobacterium sp. BFFFF1]|uniref:tail fiber domain-containing protein n=1 Tax=unclassified Flavobacterium TaxID=196869 RepID=UPI000BCBF2FE|nr:MULTISPECIES: tail fiber domain-containing protein [unclassified Flavobacterium]OYU79902.1 MAG: hypothetical protein CFE23_11645 [Flavobacterium sp. BFFFF1]
MKKLSLLLVLLLLTYSYTEAQTGINTTTPHAMLEIAPSSSTAPVSTDGIIIPRVSAFPTSPGSDQNAMLIYLTTTVSGKSPGFYYWDNPNVSWKSLGTGWLLTGNAGTTAGTNFLGTTDNVDLEINRNSTHAGFIALTSVGFGVGSLPRTSTGSSNAALGTDALSLNSSGSNNTAVGRSALKANTTGNQNTATGNTALLKNIDGVRNTGEGYASLSENVDGIDNTGIGVYAIANNVSGDENTAVGYKAGHSSTGDSNTVVGSFAMNAASSGDCNTAMGDHALNSLASGSNNIAIGCAAQVPSNTGSNQVRMGNASITYAGIQVAWTVTSDKRWKYDVKKSDLGLAFLQTLNPVSYARLNDSSKKTEYGFIAQELEKALLDSGASSNGIISKDDAGMYGVRYNDLIAISVKAVQEQQLLIDALRAENEKLEKRLNALDQKLQAMDSKVSAGNLK